VDADGGVAVGVVRGRSAAAATFDVEPVDAAPEVSGSPAIGVVGGTRSRCSAYCMIVEKSGAATLPPKYSSLLVPGWSMTTIAASRGDSAGAKPAKLAM
jgi:hypothetical protein